MFPFDNLIKNMKCKHDFQTVARIGGDTQATALKCTKCGKKKVEIDGINGYIRYETIVENGRKYPK